MPTSSTHLAVEHNSLRRAPVMEPLQRFLASGGHDRVQCEYYGTVPIKADDVQ